MGYVLMVSVRGIVRWGGVGVGVSVWGRGGVGVGVSVWDVVVYAAGD